MSTEHDNNHWYVRRGTSIQGPYTREALQRYLLLGRIRTSDRASSDGRTWYRVSECHGLLPEAMRDLDTPQGRARFEAARQAADERERDRAESPFPEPRPWLRRRLVIASSVAALAAVAIGLSVIGWLGGYVGGQAPATDCAAEPAPGIDWAYCVREGLVLTPGTDLRDLNAPHATLSSSRLTGVSLSNANLQFTDLSGAILATSDLRGADLHGADLRSADLSGADLGQARLTHADLRGAILKGTILSDADLSRAAWGDGVYCAPGSVGECREQP